MAKNFPIEFFVRVDAKKLTARITKETESARHHAFDVEFSDGFKDEFILDENAVLRGSGDRAAPYADAIRGDLIMVIGLDPERFFYVFEEIVDGVQKNVWIKEEETIPGKYSYAIHYDGHYRFELIRIWEVFSISQSKNAINYDLAYKIGSRLDRLLASLSSR